jgi:hypothetical protein
MIIEGNIYIAIQKGYLLGWQFIKKVKFNSCMLTKTNVSDNSENYPVILHDISY